MFSREIFLEETRKALSKLDSELFPETCDQLIKAMTGDDRPFIVASNLVECDKPKDLPPFLVDYITMLYEVEIAAGNDHAMNNLGARYYIGNRGFRQDFNKAMELYNMAAEHGNRQAQENLGYCYYYGRDVEVDYEKAFHYFALGAFDGWLVSLYKIGDMYLHGHYVKKNEREAFFLYNRCLQMASDEDSKYVSGPVHLRLGNLCLNGIGTEKNLQQALLHYSLAEIMLLQMVQDGDYMYKKSLRDAIDGQAKARALLMEQLPGGEWAFDDKD